MAVGGIGGIGGRLGAFASNPQLRQIFIWQVLQQFTAAILAPEVLGVQQEMFQLNASAPLSPAEAAAAVIRGYMTHAEGEHEARNSGLDARRFSIMVDENGNPPGVGELLELWRRGVIPEKGEGAGAVSYEQGVREGQTKNKWVDPLKALKTALPAPGSALAALLEGQTDAATARKLYEEWGGDPRYFELLFNTQGSAPTPLEAAMMARRGLIPWEGQGPGVTSFRQAFLEGPWRNKWEKAYREAANYIPPPRATTAMLRNGAITEAQAAKFYAWAGADAEVTAALIADAHHQKTASTRELVKADVLNLYAEGVFDRPTTLQHLADLGYSGPAAEFEVEAVDFHRVKGLIDHAVTRIHALYVGHKISKDNAMLALNQLAIPPTQRDALMQVWDLERAENVRVLTPAEVVHLVKLNILPEPEALTLLQQDGYSARDAWLRLAVGLGAPPQAPEPAA